MAKGYIIRVGNEDPAEAIVAFPNKKGEPAGDQFKRTMTVGSHLIMNRARVWGRRVIGEKKKLESGAPIEHNSIGYTGELEFLPWGDDDGSAIIIRYDPGSRSLDYDYQANVLKLDVTSEKAATQIQLKAGQNDFDYNKDAVLIKFLRVTPQNRDSKSKNPNPEIYGHVFFEITDEHVDTVSINLMETSIEAGNLVKEISNKPQALRNLFEILGNRPEFGKTNKLSGDKQIYKTLLSYSDTNASDLFSLVDAYKKDVQDSFEKAKSYKAIDLTKDGHIAFIAGTKKDLIFSGLKGKGDDMIDYVIENYLDEEVYKQTKIFKELTNKLK